MLGALFLAALTGGFPPAGAYRYSASMGGQSVGTWSVNVTADQRHAEVDENSSALVLGMQLSATGSLMLGPDLAPTQYTGNYRTPTQNLSVRVGLTAATATVTGALTPEPKQVSLAPNTRHFVVIEPGLLAGLFVLPAQLKAWNDQTLMWITPATAQAQPVATSNAALPARPSGVSSQDAVIAFDQPIAVTIWYDPATLVPDQISVPSQNAVLTRIR
jgi:hypothetical protein